VRLDLDAASSVPLYRQIVDQVRRLVALGALKPGDRLPAVRDLAVQARVNRNTAARAIQALEAQGVVRTRVGQGTFVADDAPGASEELRDALLEDAMERLLREAGDLGVAPREVSRRLAGKVGETPDEKGGKS